MTAAMTALEAGAGPRAPLSRSCSRSPLDRGRVGVGALIAASICEPGGQGPAPRRPSLGVAKGSGVEILDAHPDAVAIRRSGKEKTEFFFGVNHSTHSCTVRGRSCKRTDERPDPQVRSRGTAEPDSEVGGRLASASHRRQGRAPARGVLLRVGEVVHTCAEGTRIRRAHSVVTRDFFLVASRASVCDSPMRLWCRVGPLRKRGRDTMARSTQAAPRGAVAKFRARIEDPREHCGHISEKEVSFLFSCRCVQCRCARRIFELS